MHFSILHTPLVFVSMESNESATKTCSQCSSQKVQFGIIEISSYRFFSIFLSRNLEYTIVKYGETNKTHL